MRMSIASMNSPSTFLSTPSMPTSAIWCCAQLDEQPAKCRRKSSPWPLGRTCSSRNAAISTARDLVYTFARPQNSLPVQVCRPRWNSVGVGVRSADQRLLQERLDVLVRDPRQHDVLLVGEAQRVVFVRAVLAGERDQLEQLRRLQAADRDDHADRRVLAVGLGEDADVVLAREARGLRDAVAQVAADARDDLGAQAVAAEAVDEELQARLAARLPVLVGVAEDAGDRGDDLGGLLGRDEDVDPAGEARLRWRARRRRAG